MYINIPIGRLAADEDIEAAEKRKKLREMLLNGEKTVVTKGGELKVKGDTSSEEVLLDVPEGKLAFFHWYEKDPALLKGEKKAMAKIFGDQFKLDNDNGVLSWIGYVNSPAGDDIRWYLQAKYNNNHPDNSSYGGSVRIYLIKPSIEDMSQKLDETIPHLLRDTAGFPYLCTAGKEDIRIGDTVTTAASSIGWSIRWLAAFELWISGNLSTEEFREHF